MATNSQRAPGEPPPSDQPGLQESTLGALLKSARERRGLTLQQIFAETRIPLRHLEALERDRLSALPTGLYLRAEVRTYAKAVHLDPEVAVRMLDLALVPPVKEVPAPAAPPAHTPVRQVRRPLVIGIGMLLVVVASTFAFWKRGGIPIFSGRANPQSGERPTSVDSGQTPQPATQQQPVPAPSATTGDLQDEQRSDIVLEPAPTEESAAATPIGELDTQLIVITQPPGARVTINGIGWGDTPATIRHLPPGEKRIRVSLDGYEAAERVVDLGDAQPGRITIRLRRIQ